MAIADIVYDNVSILWNLSNQVAIKGNQMKPYRFTLLRNYPNPFNARTVITYELQIESNVTIAIYDLLGRKVVTLSDGFQQAGNHQVIWNADGRSSGVYFYKIKAGDEGSSKKMILIK